MTIPESRTEMSLSERIVTAILDDMTDRRGLRHEWDNIDDDIQTEIAETWVGLVDAKLKEFLELRY